MELNLQGVENLGNVRVSSLITGSETSQDLFLAYQEKYFLSYDIYSTISPFFP